MTEGSGTVKTKRLGARFFKNPPQPHMCIRDSLKGSLDPCYVNVLSWDKVTVRMPSKGVQLYGGMKVCPPRTEKKEVAVFAVMANPEILKIHGKNAWNPKERSWLIDALLDFVEKMNEGIIFNRRYTVLRDRDITGELKEIWMVVQSERAKAQQTTGSDELRRPVPQYPHYQEQHQQQQQQHSISQLHQHPHEEHIQQPPQYHSSVYYTQESNENCEGYELSCGRQNVIISTKERMYLQQYESNGSRVDRYIFGEPAIVLQNPQVVPQQNCLNYPAYQYQQLPQAIGGQFPPNIHPGATLNCPPGVNPSMGLMRPAEPPMHYNKLPIDKFYKTFRRMPPPIQPQHPQIGLGAPASSYYEPQNPPPPAPAPPNFLRMIRAQESQDNGRRQPPPPPASNLTRTKPTIVMLEPRDALVVPPPPPLPPLPPEELESSASRVAAPLLVHQQQQQQQQQPQHLLNLPINTSMNNCLPRDQNPSKPSTISFLKLFRPQEAAEDSRKEGHFGPPEAQSAEENETPNCHEESSTNPRRETSVGSRNAGQQLPANSAKEQQNCRKGGGGGGGGGGKQTKIKVLKRNNNVALGEQKGSGLVVTEPKACFFASKAGGFREAKGLVNGEAERPRDSKTKDRTSGKDADVEDRLNKLVPDSERNGNAAAAAAVAKQRNNNTTRIAGKTTSLRNTLKILAGAATPGDESGNKKNKNNGQVKSQGGKADNGGEIMQVYTILRKPEATTSQEDVTSNIAQLSFSDCGGEAASSQIGAVLS